jgi:hypothetical protein
LLKRLYTICLIVAVLALPVMAAAKAPQEVALGNATVASDNNTITVPVEIANGDHLIAIDMAFKFSPGVTIKEVRFDGGRIADWDLKASILRNADRTVVIMAVPQLTMTEKPPLSEGSGLVAQLVFTKNDPSVQTVTLEPTTVENPHHHVFFVYGFTDATGAWQQWTEEPTIKAGAISIAASSANVPKAYALNQNYPNPFNPSTQISFDLPAAGRVELSVYNVLGQNVRTLASQDMEAGTHTVTWDGRSSGGTQVASGIYFYRLTAGSYSRTMKMMMLK